MSTTYHTRQVRARWQHLLQSTGTTQHPQHTLATMLLYAWLTDTHAPCWVAHHRRMLSAAIRVLENT